MAVPTVMSDLSTTIASNSPAGSDSPTQGDDNIRALMGIVRREASLGSNIASATTITPDALSASASITGTTAITTIASTNSWDGRRYLVKFNGALTLTHGSNLICPGGASITTAAGDIAELWQSTSGTWYVVWYTFATGQRVTGLLKTIGISGGTAASFAMQNFGNSRQWRWVNGNASESDGTLVLSEDIGARTVMTVLPAGNVTIAAPSSGASLTCSGILLLSAQPTVDATLSAARTTTGVFTTYTENIDTGAGFNNGTGVFTAPVAGTYLISYAASLSVGTNSDGYANFGLRKNGTGVSGSQATCKIATNTLQATVSIMRILVLAASDTIDVELLVINGTAASTVVNALTIRLIG